ncbi:10957_t:CDS:2 [Gigaspora rosea]|nr:10957_t:CDS:2 [Gigaspora rosea]
MSQEQQLAYRKSESEKKHARRKRQLEEENTNQDEHMLFGGDFGQLVIM